MAPLPIRRKLTMPLPRYGLKTLCARLCLLFGLARLTGIDARGQLLAGCVALLSRSLQGLVRIDAEGKPFLFAAEAIFPTLVLTPAITDFQIQPAAIGQLVAFLPRLRRTNLNVG